MKAHHCSGNACKGNRAGTQKPALGISFVLVLFALLNPLPPASAGMNLDQTLSDGAQSSTIAFDGFAMITGSFEAQSFFPPGKLADYWGFQYLRDNTPDGNGHNTSFLTNCAFNVLYTLSDDQFAMLKTLAANQVDQINLYAYKRFPLMKAFRRQLEGDIPAGSSGLSLSAVKTASADLYALDGQISFDRAAVYAAIYKTLNTTQEAHFAAMKSGGFDSWTVTAEMDSAVRERMRGVSHDVSVALMTYAGDLFSWYAGSLDADVYFCPERQGTYFGSFYVKDAPAIGHEGYKIDEQLTASAGQKFLAELATTDLDSLVTSLVDEQRDNLYAGAQNIVQVRSDISSLLRSLIAAPVLTDELKAPVLSEVLEKSRTYGELDGEIVYSYVMAFAEVSQQMNDAQKADMAALRKSIMSGVYNDVPFDYSVCTTPYLYSAVIEDTSVLDPYIANTDYLFGMESTGTLTVSITGNGKVISSPAGINCGSTCSAQFQAGTEILLTAEPAAGSVFKGWSDARCVGTGPCTLLIGGETTAITAEFAVTTYSISGTVKDGRGLPVPRVNMILNGAVNRSVATNADGSYVFTDLAKGLYTITAREAQSVFAPAKVKVNIDSGNIAGVDFLKKEHRRN